MKGNAGFIGGLCPCLERPTTHRVWSMTMSTTRCAKCAEEMKQLGWMIEDSRPEGVTEEGE